MRGATLVAVAIAALGCAGTPELQDPGSVGFLERAQEQVENMNVGYVFGPKDERRRTRTWSRVKTGL